MSTQKRLTAASAAAILGLFLAGCDNTDTAETPDAPAETTAPVEDGTTTPGTGNADGDDTDTDGDDTDGDTDDTDTDGDDTDTDGDDTDN